LTFPTLKDWNGKWVATTTHWTFTTAPAITATAARRLTAPSTRLARRLSDL
jgi:hypothetical protein